MFEPISSAAAVDLLGRIIEFREGGSRPTPTEETAALLALFPSVRVRDGYLLDFSQETTAAGVTLPIRPYGRPASDDSWMPIFDEETEPDSQRADLVEQLYQYLEYDRSPQGLFEYAFFSIELWSLRLSRHAADWLESTPIFTADAFDAALAASGKEAEAKRPDFFGPKVEMDDDGGRVRFLVYTPMGWERVYYLNSQIFSDGFVEQEAGEIIADLGSGLIF